MRCFHREHSYDISLHVRLHLLKRDERVLIVWSDDLDKILSLCNDFENKLMKLVWRSRTVIGGTPSLLSNSGSASIPPSTTASDVNLAEKPNSESQISSVPSLTQEVRKPKHKSRWNWARGLTRKAAASPTDLEKGLTPQPRPTRLLAPFYSGFGAGLSVCTSSMI